MTLEPISTTISVPVPAATILLVRDGSDGLEVFMVERHHEIDFGGGALVFTGGKAGTED
jgi:8-oxo-dGTP pyrophosphatase MutT (NUDIX family)